eukprot:5641697-Prymnesium_polylepis.1
MRNDLAPTSAGSSPAAAAQRWASARTPAVRTTSPTASAKNGASSGGAVAAAERVHQSAAGRPRVSTGKGAPPCRRRHHASAIASYAQSGSAPNGPSCRRAIGVG